MSSTSDGNSIKLMLPKKICTGKQIKIKVRTDKWLREGTMSCGGLRAFEFIAKKFRRPRDSDDDSVKVIQRIKEVLRITKI